MRRAGSSAWSGSAPEGAPSPPTGPPAAGREGMQKQGERVSRPGLRKGRSKSPNPHRPLLFPSPLVLFDCDVSGLKGSKNLLRKKKSGLPGCGEWGRALGGGEGRATPTSVGDPTVDAGAKSEGQAEPQEPRCLSCQRGRDPAWITQRGPGRVARDHRVARSGKGAQERGCRGRGGAGGGAWSGRGLGPRASGVAAREHPRTCIPGQPGYAAVLLPGALGGGRSGAGTGALLRSSSSELFSRLG